MVASEKKNVPDEFLRVRAEMAEDAKKLKSLLKRIEQGQKVRQKTLDATLRRSTVILKKLAKLAVKSLPSFIIVFLSRDLPTEQRVVGYLVAAIPLVKMAMKAARNTVDYIITYNVAIPFIFAYQTIAFAVNAVVTVSWSVLSVALKARRLVASSTPNSP